MWLKSGMQLVVLFTIVGFVGSMPEPLQVSVEDVETSDINPEENKGYFEGDIQQESSRNALRDRNRRWPNGVVYYKISSVYPTSTRNIIVQAMREIESNTKHGSHNCIRFVERTNQHDYIHVQKHTGCHSHVGRAGGEQEVSIGSGCERKGTIMHELIHALGFHHEQSRYDRDQYVDIHSDNIGSIEMHNFIEFKSRTMDLLGTPYDFGSIMHYNAYSFAEDKSKPTITPKPGKGVGVTMGQRLAMSNQDTSIIQKYYECTVDTSHITHPPTSSHVVDCNFESDLCGLTSDGGNLQWTRKAGSTPTGNTGPNADHTNGAGHYIYAEASNNYNKKARLRTKDITRGAYCLDFYIFQHGRDERTFQILVAGDHVHEQAVKTITGDQGNLWKHFRINVNAPATVHFVLQATTGSSPLSDIAIDDFQLYHGRCL